MAVKIRLMRVGKKKQPTYRIVVADSRSPRDGRFIEIIGQYAPRQEPSQIQIDTDRALAWLEKGAQPTEQVGKILDASGVWDAYRSATGKDAAAKPKPKTPRAKTPKAPKAGAGEGAAPAAAEPAADAPSDDTESGTESGTDAAEETSE